MKKVLFNQIRDWSENAKKGELIARRDHAYELRRKIKDKDEKKFLNEMIGIIDAEIVSRAEVWEFDKAYQESEHQMPVLKQVI